MSLVILSETIGDLWDTLWSTVSSTLDGKKRGLYPLTEILKIVLNKGDKRWTEIYGSGTPASRYVKFVDHFKTIIHGRPDAVRDLIPWLKYQWRQTFHHVCAGGGSGSAAAPASVAPVDSLSSDDGRWDDPFGSTDTGAIDDDNDDAKLLRKLYAAAASITRQVTACKAWRVGINEAASKREAERQRLWTIYEQTWSAILQLQKPSEAELQAHEAAKSKLDEFASVRTAYEEVDARVNKRIDQLGAIEPARTADKLHAAAEAAKRRADEAEAVDANKRARIETCAE